MKKETKKKLIVFIIVFAFILLAIVSRSIAFAEPPGAEAGAAEGAASETESAADSTIGPFSKIITGLISGVVGILLLIPILLADLILLVGYGLVGFLTSGISNFQFLTPDALFFNKINITNPMILVNPSFAEEAGYNELSVSVAVWFRVILLFTIGILFFILIYLSIRAMVSTKAETLANVKDNLVNWAVSVGLLLFLVIIIVASVYLNDAFIRILSNTMEDAYSPGDMIESLFVSTLTFFNPFLQVTSIFILAGLLVLSLKFFGAYLKRIINLAFLIIIAPVITITYSIDKMGDKKAQALSSWYKEFLGKIFIQPVHAILYFIIISMVTGISGLSGGIFESYFSFDIMKPIMVIIALNFIDDMEKLLKKMFNLGKGTSIKEGNDLAQLVVGSKTIGIVSNAAKKASNTYREKHIKFERLPETNEDEQQEGNEFFDEGEEQEQTQELYEYEVTGDNIDLEGNGVETIDDEEFEDENTTDDGEYIGGSDVQPIEGDEEPALLDRGIDKAASLYRGILDNKWSIAGSLVGFGLDNDLGGALTGYGAGAALDEYTGTRREFRKSRKAQLNSYNDGVKVQSERTASNIAAFAALNGINMDPDTREGKAAIQEFFNKLNEVGAKDNILEDFKKAVDDYKKHLMDDRNYTMLEAESAVSKVISDAVSGKVDNTLDAEGRNLASHAILNNAMGQKIDFENDFALIEGSFDDVRDRVIKGSSVSPELAQKLKTFKAISQPRGLGKGADSLTALSLEERRLVEKFRQKLDNLTYTEKTELDSVEKEANKYMNKYESEFGTDENMLKTMEDMYMDGANLEEIVKHEKKLYSDYNSGVNDLNNNILEMYNKDLPDAEKISLGDVEKYTALEGYNKRDENARFKKAVANEYTNGNIKAIADAKTVRINENVVKNVDAAINNSSNKKEIQDEQKLLKDMKKAYNSLFNDSAKTKELIKDFVKETGQSPEELLKMKAEFEKQYSENMKKQIDKISNLDGVKDTEKERYISAKGLNTPNKSNTLYNSYTELHDEGYDFESSKSGSKNSKYNGDPEKFMEDKYLEALGDIDTEEDN